MHNGPRVAARGPREDAVEEDYQQVPLPACTAQMFDVGAVGEVQAARAKVAKARRAMAI